MARNINLFDPSLRPKRDLLSAHNLLLAALLATLLVSCGAMWARWRQASIEQQSSSVQRQLKQQREAFDKLTMLLSGKKEDQALVSQLAEQEKALKGAQTALSVLRKMTLAAERPVVGEMMRAFARSGVDGLWLTGFSIEGEAQNLEIRGRMTDQALLPAYLKRLEGEPVFQGRRFAALNMRSGEVAAASTSPAAVNVPAPLQPAAAMLAATRPAAAPAQANVPARWYVDFVLRTQRDTQPATAGGAQP